MPELPLEIWKDRIENEVRSLEGLHVLENDSVIHQEMAVELIINVNAIGFIMKQDADGLDLIPQKSHRVFLKLNRSFPYPGGVDFSWYSNIFHPNIHPVNLPTGETGTGYICLNVLKKWSRLSDLESTVKALQMLIEHPNPEDPLNYPICLEATEFFRQNTMEDLREQYDLDEVEAEEEEDEDIIIID